MSAALPLIRSIGAVATLTALGLSVATFYRRRQPAAPKPKRPTPARALSTEERRDVLAVLHEPRFADKAPAEVIATLLGEGRAPCSERTMYRILDRSEERRVGKEC